MTYSQEDNMTMMLAVAAVQREDHLLPLFAVVCQEHGGVVFGDAMSALAAAQRLNDDGACHYWAVAIGCDPATLARNIAEETGLVGPRQEPGKDEL